MFEAGDEVTEEEADRFLREAVGALSDNQLVIRLRRFRSRALPAAPDQHRRPPSRDGFVGALEQCGAAEVALTHCCDAAVSARGGGLSPGDHF